MPYGKKKINLLYEDLTYEIRGLLFEVQKEQGRFAKEKQYADLLEKKIIGKNWKFSREERISDTGNITDFIIQDKVVIELKSKPFLLKSDYYQLQRYLYSTQIKLGILVNFREPYLNPKRVLLAQSVDIRGVRDQSVNPYEYSKKTQLTIVVALIKNEQGKLLLAKRNEPQTPEIHGRWEFLGGSIEFGESPEQAIVREVKEESGLEVKVVNLFPKILSDIQSFKNMDAKQVIVITYECKVVGGKLTLGISDEISDLKYFTHEEIKKLHTFKNIKELPIF